MGFAWMLLSLSLFGVALSRTLVKRADDVAAVDTLVQQLTNTVNNQAATLTAYEARFRK